MEEIKKEAYRLVELYVTNKGLTWISTRDAIQCAIIDVSNTIADNTNMLKWAKDKKAPEDILHGINGNIGWHKQVKQELESRL